VFRHDVDPGTAKAIFRSGIDGIVSDVTADIEDPAASEFREWSSGFDDMEFS
jgi:hypothetical protein